MAEKSNVEQKVHIVIESFTSTKNESQKENKDLKGKEDGQTQ